MKYLGIDYGTKRTGIAFSDDEGSLAFPHSVLLTTKAIAKEIAALAREARAETIVLGESLDLAGKPNPLMKQIDILKHELEAEEFTVYFEREFYTSQQAARLQGENDMHDASAAALILQSFLDKQRKKAVDSDPYKPL